MTRKFLTAEWRYLALLNFEVPPKVLAPFLPRGVALDDWHGTHYISLVGFVFLGTRIFGVPALFHQNFEEINLRFYVRRQAEVEAHSGVVFIRELVSLPLVAGAARLSYNEPYRTVPTGHTLVELNGKLQSVEYLFGRPRDRCRLAMHVEGHATEIASGSQEEFLSQRGWGFTRQVDGGTIEYRVDHPRWRVWRHARWELDGPLATFYDQPFADILRGEPSSAFVADGSPVSVYLPERIA
jgi:uncharacterized protein